MKKKCFEVFRQFDGLPLCEVFRESLLSNKNFSKRVMGDSRAKATIVSHHPRSGSPMGKIVPKGDFSHLVYRSHKMYCYLYYKYIKIYYKSSNGLFIYNIISAQKTIQKPKKPIKMIKKQDL